MAAEFADTCSGKQGALELSIGPQAESWGDDQNQAMGQRQTNRIQRKSAISGSPFYLLS